MERFPFKTFVVAVVLFAGMIGLSITLDGCAGVINTVRDQARGIAERYCLANEIDRKALRALFSSDAGPWVQVNCENL